MNKQTPHRQPPITAADLEDANRRADEGVFISREKIHAWLRSLDDDPNAPPPEPDVFVKSGD